MTAYHPHQKPFAGACCARVAPRATMVQARALWASDSTRKSSLNPSLMRGDKQWEVDSMAEVDGS